MWTNNAICIVSSKLIVDEKGIKDSWMEYMEKLMNEENEWDHKLKKDKQIASGSVKLLQHWKSPWMTFGLQRVKMLG